MCVRFPESSLPCISISVQVTKIMHMLAAASPTSTLSVDADAQSASEPRPARQLRFEEPTWCDSIPITLMRAEGVLHVRQLHLANEESGTVVPSQLGCSTASPM